MKPPSASDSRAVVGQGDWGHHRGHQGGQSVLLGPVDNPLAGFKNDPNNILKSLKVSIFRNPATMETFRESEMLCWVLLMIFSQALTKIA